MLCAKTSIEMTAYHKIYSVLETRESIWLDRTLFLIFISYRLTLLLLVRSSFVPDELYQYVEPAYAVISGIGIRTWEWQSEHKIRSSVSLLPLISSYKFLQLTGFDHSDNLKLLPRFLFTIMTIYSDYCFQQLSKTILATNLSYTDNILLSSKQSYVLKSDQLAYIIHLLSWSLSYCLTRTLGNSMETCFLIIGTSWLFPSNSTSSTATSSGSSGSSKVHGRAHRVDNSTVQVSNSAIVIAIVSVYLRPTAVLLWIPLFIWKLYTSFNPFSVIVKQIVPICLLVLQVCVLVDSYYYGEFSLPPLQFYTANITKDYASIFGVQPWYWAFTQGLPVVLGIYTPLVLYSFCTYTPSLSQSHRVLQSISLLYMISLACMSPHMEIRFLLPCLPFLHLTAGLMLRQGLLWALSIHHSWWYSYIIQGIVASSLVVQTIVVVYLLYYHQCGTELAMQYVGHDIMTEHMPLHKSEGVNIYIAAPCFAFPGYAGLQLPFHAWETSVLDSSSSRNSDSTSSGSGGSSRAWIKIHTTPCNLRVSKEEHFDTSPVEHIAALLASERSVSEELTFSAAYVLTFDAYVPVLENTLLQHSFTLFTVLPHAYFKYDYDDIYNKQNIYIYKRQSLHIKVNNDNYSETDFLTDHQIHEEIHHTILNHEGYTGTRGSTKKKVYSEPIQLYSKQNPVDRIKFQNFVKSNIILPLI